MPLAPGVHAHRIAHDPAGPQIARRVHRMARLGRRVAGNDGLHGYGLNDQALTLHQEGKALSVSRLEARLNLVDRTKSNHQCGVAALVTHVHTTVRGKNAATDLLALQFSLG